MSSCSPVAPNNNGVLIMPRWNEYDEDNYYWRIYFINSKYDGEVHWTPCQQRINLETSQVEGQDFQIILFNKKFGFLKRNDYDLSFTGIESIDFDNPDDNIIRDMIYIDSSYSCNQIVKFTVTIATLGLSTIIVGGICTEYSGLTGAAQGTLNIISFGNSINTQSSHNHNIPALPEPKINKGGKSICPSCVGTGRDMKSDVFSEPCRRCGGKGTISYRRRSNRKCYLCGGTGSL